MSQHWRKIYDEVPDLKKPTDNYQVLRWIANTVLFLFAAYIVLASIHRLGIF